MSIEKVRTYLFFFCLMMSLTGCQQLFHGQDAPLKGQTVSVAMTVPTLPPPAVTPLQQNSENTPPSKTANAPLDTRLLPVQAPAAADSLALKSLPVSASRQQVKPARSQNLKAETVLAGKTIAEDVVLRGSVLIRGSLVILPQATVRIEPGTVIRFVPVPGSEELPRLVVQGRIVASGTAVQPVVIGSTYHEPAAGDWGGIVLLNSEKKNSLDHCRIEGAQTAVEAHFSRFSGRGLSVVRSYTGIVLFDSEATLQGSSISRCDTGCRLSDSELDLKDSTVRENRIGIVAGHSSFSLTAVRIVNSSQEGVLSEQSRFRLNNSLFSENRSGIRLIGGDGQIFLCRFLQNRESGAELARLRVRISASTFAKNIGTGLVVENVRGSVTGSVFSDNKLHNLKKTGDESFAALLNWWGSADEKLIAAGIDGYGRKDANNGVLFSPFLKERPGTAP